MTTAGDADTQTGMAAHMLFVTASMENEYLFNADGEYLVVAAGWDSLRFFTEFGIIEIEPGEICIIPRGLMFRSSSWAGRRAPMSARTTAAPSRCPNAARSAPTASPIRGDFLTPVAAYEDHRGALDRSYAKWGGELFKTEIGQSPLDVVAWHGNYAPYKYDLRRFSPVGAVSCSIIPTRRSSPC
jgi:homogentisate 1,2-dioxygenase